MRIQVPAQLYQSRGQLSLSSLHPTSRSCAPFRLIHPSHSFFPAFSRRSLLHPAPSPLHVPSSTACSSCACACPPSWPVQQLRLQPCPSTSARPSTRRPPGPTPAWQRPAVPNFLTIEEVIPYLGATNIDKTGVSNAIKRVGSAKKTVGLGLFRGAGAPKRQLDLWGVIGSLLGGGNGGGSNGECPDRRQTTLD